MPMASRLPRTARLPLLTSFLVLLLTPICDSFSSSAMGSSRILKPRLFSRTCEPSRAPGQGVRGLRADVTVSLPTPLGIVFEEVEPGQSSGLVVADLVPGGNAQRDGRIWIGDKLVATSAVVLDKSNQPLISLGATSATTNWKREMIPCGNLDFNTIMNAIKSNSGRYGYKDVRLTVRRTEKSKFPSTETIVRKKQDDDNDDVDLPLKVRPDPWQE